MRVRELSLRNYRVFDEADLELPARVIGIFGPNGAGKCLPGWIRMFDPDAGEAIPIERFVRERRKRTLGLVDTRIERVDVLDWHDLGFRDTVIVTLENGAAFEVAATHPILTDRGFVPAETLTRQHWVAETGRLPESGPARLSVDEALIVGLLLGDGTLTAGPLLSANDPAIIDAFRSAVERVFRGCTVAPTSSTRRSTWMVVSASKREDRQRRASALARRLAAGGIPLEAYIGVNVARFLRGDSAVSYETLRAIEDDYGIDLYEERAALHGGRVFLEWAKSLGLMGQIAATKRVPGDLLLLPDDQVKALLAGLWLTDGWIIPQQASVCYSSSSRQLAEDVRILLKRLGMSSSIRTQIRAGKPHHRVILTTSAARRFGEIPLVGRKAQRVVDMLAVLAGRSLNPNADLIPPSFNTGLPTTSKSGRYRTREQLAQHAMSRDVFLDFGGSPDIATAEIAWSRVHSLESTGRRERCFDVTVDSETRSYVAETLIVHNSSLVEAVRFALYGRARTEKKEIRTHGVLTDCEVRVVFEHGGQQYEVRRRIKGKGHQTEAELFVGDLQAAAGVTEVDEEIRRLLRMDEQVFRASVFAEQKQLDAFSDVTKGKRKEMVLRLLGIRPVDDARAAARKESRDVTAAAERLAATLPDLAEEETRLEELRRQLDDARQAATAAETALEEAEARGREAEAAYRASDRRRQEAERLADQREAAERERLRYDERTQEIKARLEALRAEVSELPSLREELDVLRDADARLAAGRKAAEVAGEVEEAEAALASLPALDPEAALGELQEAEAEHREADREVARTESRLERLRDQLATAQETLERTAELDPSAPCPTCGQELAAGFASYVEHCRLDADRLGGEVAAAERAVEELAARRAEADGRFAAARRAGEAAQRATQQRTAAEERLERLRVQLEAATAAFDGGVPDVAALEADAARARTLGGRVAELEAHQRHLDEDERDLAAARTQLEEAAKRLADLDRRLGEVAFDPEDHARLEKEESESRRLLEEARTSERQAARRLAHAENETGKLHASLEQARRTKAKVAELRQDARYVQRVSILLDGFRDHLVTRIGPELSREAEALFRELTNHEYDDLRIDEDTMGIEIADGTEYFPIERFSGSEADLANLALRVAISMHLSRMSGADIGMMVLDEVLGSLDVERKDLFVQAMGRLADRFNQLFVITHAEQVKDAFPASIEVRKIGRRRSQAVLV